MLGQSVTYCRAFVNDLKNIRIIRFHFLPFYMFILMIDIL